MIKQGSALLTSLLCVVLLTSCSKGTVKTVDASVEYNSAKSLPALQKRDAGAQAISQTKAQLPTSFDGSVVSDKKGSFILMNVEDEVAWNHLEAALDSANITVYGRSKEGGLFFVSCGPDAVPAERAKAKRILFFKSKLKFSHKEYCSLITKSVRKKKTSVTLLDQNGKRVISSYSKEMYNRIVSN